jgi:hypothetical protein
MSTQPGFAGSESDPEFDDEPTAVQEEPTSQWRPAEPQVAPPPVAPPPELGAAGNAQPGLLTAASSDRCTNCGAQLAPDQHYCVVCGERRGRARFAGAMFGPQAVAQSAPAPAAAAGSAQRGGRLPSSATLIAGVATLLVAMGLGILIGHDSSTNRTIAPQPKVNVTVNGGGGGGAGSSTGASTTASSRSTSKSSSKAAKSSTAAPKVSAAQQQKSQAAASKVLGASSAKTAPPTVQPGQKCTHGAGCQGGKFTGNFFGG